MDRALTDVPNISVAHSRHSLPTNICPHLTERATERAEIALGRAARTLATLVNKIATAQSDPTAFVPKKKDRPLLFHSEKNGSLFLRKFAGKAKKRDFLQRGNQHDGVDRSIVDKDMRKMMKMILQI